MVRNARNSPGRVLVAMSGGVDSSVAACLLHEQGYDVLGVFMRLGAQDHEPLASASVPPEACESPSSLSLPIAGQTHASATDRHRGCCSAADASDARRVAGQLGIPFYALNFEQDFSRLIDHFADEYARARTPNPCVRCNSWLKFGKLLDYADAVQADFIATGHFARIDRSSGRPRLLRARHTDKDQSYVLFGISNNALNRALFPLGELTKAEVRAHARRLGLALHNKPESQDICFAPDRDYARIVRQRRPDALRAGEIRHVDGRLLGRHEGIAHFTIGQRRGVGVAVGSPVYVSRIDADTVTVGPHDAVCSDIAVASEVHWLADPPTGPFRASARIRYNHEAASATVTPLADDRVEARFDQPQFAVTPGQALVIYDGDAVLGGGWIESA